MSDQYELDPLEHVLGTSPALRAGYFRFYFDGRRWEWSDEVASIHGYAPGEAQPSTELLLEHKHPDDRQQVAAAMQQLFDEGVPFSSRHRIVDAAGRTREVLVVGDRMLDEDGAVVGSDGFYVDLTDLEHERAQDEITEAITEISEQRAVVERATGMLMLIYGISAQRALDVLLWRSQTTNTKLRVLAERLLSDVVAGPPASPQLRHAFDHLLLTAHQRAGNPK